MATHEPNVVQAAFTPTLIDMLAVSSRPLSPRLSEFVGMIESRFTSCNVSVKVLKRDCGIRDHNFSLVFRREVGMTIRDYIECLRVQTACNLLDKGTVTAAEAGYAVGYEHLQTFYRAFRRRVSCTPGQYLARVEGKRAA
jgi:AraC-like DNA-binding protein